MELLDIKARQTVLRKLGFYTGKIDGIEGAQTKAAYLKVQRQNFTRKKDMDGLYGNDTDILLRNIEEFSKVKHFTLNEFKCKCGGRYCTGYPTVIDGRLLQGLEKVRTEYGRAVSIRSGFRCRSWNSLQAGSSQNSRHCLGKAADIFIDDITTANAGRTKLIAYWYAAVKGRYAYGNINGNHPNMGNSVHVDVT